VVEAMESLGKANRRSMFRDLGRSLRFIERNAIKSGFEKLFRYFVEIWGNFSEMILEYGDINQELKPYVQSFLSFIQSIPS
jgi:hypothetical protein